MNTDIVTDLIVVIPGITGSKLRKDGRYVWNLSGGAIVRGLAGLGGTIRQLQLPEDLGDDSPDDGVEPDGLMPGTFSIPGVGPVVAGYGPLVRWLKNSLDLSIATPRRAGNLLLFAYDWRLSNRYNAERLRSEVDRALVALHRSQGSTRARAILICHSMGGLLARYYVEVLGGLERTKALVTLGTPHRGSADALLRLVNGASYSVAGIRIDVSSFARSLPSLYQLLPTYQCVAGDADRLAGVESSIRRPLRRDSVRDAVNFHQEIVNAATRNQESQVRMRWIVGSRQPTILTVRYSGHELVGSELIGSNREYGDGTVPTFAAIPSDAEPGDTRQVHCTERHGHLPSKAAILDDIWGIVKARERQYRGPLENDVDVGLRLPELVVHNEPFVVQVEGCRKDMQLELLVKPAGSARPEVAALTQTADEVRFAQLSYESPNALEIAVRSRGSNRLPLVTGSVIVL